MSIEMSFAKFNEKDPWGKSATVITPDNLAHSRVRREAITAMRDGKATPEQQLLVAECDRVMVEALDGRDTS